MQNSFSQERRLWQAAVILDITSDLQETALNSGSLPFIQGINYWVFNSLLNQPRFIAGVDLMSNAKEEDCLSILADYAVHKFKSISPKGRLSQLPQIMDYMHPYSEAYKDALEDLNSLGISPEQGGHLNFEMLDIKLW